MLAKMQDIDRRVIYVLFMVLSAAPYLSPFMIPMRINDITQGVYNAIEALKPGDVVLIDMRFTASSVPGHTPGYYALLSHVLKKPEVKIIWMSTDPNGPIYSAIGIKMAEDAGRAYGKDLVDLGYLAGEETAIAAVSKDIHKACQADVRGTKTGDIEVLRGVKDAKDIALVLNLSDGGLGPLGWIRQAHMPYGTKVASLLGQVMVPSAMPYYQSKQVVGLINSLPGAAEYETLIKAPGRGLAAMGVQTVGLGYVIFMVVLANIGFLVSKAEGQRRQEGR